MIPDDSPTGEPMPNQEGPDPIDIGIRIVLSTAGELATWSKPTHAPSLGPDFALFLERVEPIKRALLDQIVNWYKSRTKSDLAAMFNRNGVAVADEAKIWQNEKRRNVSEFVRSLTPEIAAGLGAPNMMADFHHWSRAAFYSVDEVLWLSCGLDPHASFSGRSINVPSQVQDRNGTYSFVRRRRDILHREFDPAFSNRKITPKNLYAWILTTGFEAHEGFVEMLAMILARFTKADPSLPSMVLPASQVEGRKMGDRERKSLATLIVAMAIDGYGYDPSAARSPFPKELEDIVALLGLEISQDTIRKYLKLGAGYLPQGWKADSR